MSELQDFVKITRRMFYCNVCQNILTPVVMLVENVGNVCQDCFNGKYDDAEEYNFFLNNELSKIMQGLSFPCKSKSNGCGMQLLYKDLENHYNACIFQKTECQLLDENCDWAGDLLDLPEHFSSEHTKFVVNYEQSQFLFDINLSKFKKIFKVLVSTKGTFLLKINKCGDYVSHAVQAIRNGTGSDEMVIRYVGKRCEHSTKVACLPFTNFKGENQASKISLAVLEETVECEENVNVVITFNVSQKEDVNELVLTVLECPVCNEMMRTPIYQCPRGHSFCKSCRPKLQNCPTCRSAWTAQEIRNFHLEELTMAIQHLCINTHFGCKETFLLSEIRKHEVSCKYKTYNCPLAGCTFSGNYDPMKNHLMRNHADVLIEHASYISSFHATTTNNDVKYCVEDGNIYKVSFQYTNGGNATWRTEILNDFDENVKYVYSVTIMHFDAKEVKFLKSQLCSAVNATNVSFSSNEFQNYKNPTTGLVNYYFEIDAKDD